MDSQTKGLRVASILFGLMCVAQVMRLIIQPEVQVAGHAVPLWPSALAVVFLGALSTWMWSLTRRITR
jgi:hypothetical protein